MFLSNPHIEAISEPFCWKNFENRRFWMAFQGNSMPIAFPQIVPFLLILKHYVNTVQGVPNGWGKYFGTVVTSFLVSGISPFHFYGGKMKGEVSDTKNKATVAL